MKRFFGGRRMWALAGASLVVLAAVAAVSLRLASEGSASSDEATIAEVISEFNRAQCETIAVPEGAIETVEARQAALRADDDWQPSTESGGSCPRILPDAAWNAINEKYEATIEKCCTLRLASLLTDGESQAQQLNEALYNNPTLAVTVEEQTRIMAVKCVKLEDSTCIAWAYGWYGDVDTDGKGPQDWIIWEFSLVKDAEQWLIDGYSTLIGVDAPRDASDKLVSDEWGPRSPQMSLTGIGCLESSEVYDDPYVLLAHLQDFQKEVLAGE